VIVLVLRLERLTLIEVGPGPPGESAFLCGLLPAFNDQWSYFVSTGIILFVDLF
jgi:hypothetical protein